MFRPAARATSNCPAHSRAVLHAVRGCDAFGGDVFVAVFHEVREDVAAGDDAEDVSGILPRSRGGVGAAVLAAGHSAAAAVHDDGDVAVAADVHAVQRE